MHNVFSRPWLCYWILHSVALLGDAFDDEVESNAVDFLNRCQVCKFNQIAFSNLAFDICSSMKIVVLV